MGEITSRSMIIKEDDGLCLVKSTMDHVDYLAPRLRDIDLLELEMLRVEPRYALAYPFTQDGSISYTLLYRKNPIAMMGTVSSWRPDYARVWMLSSGNIRKCRKIIARNTKWMVDLLQGDYARLHNIIPLENMATRKWLQNGGFTFGHKVDINGFIFVEFFRCNSIKNIIYNEMSRPVMH